MRWKGKNIICAVMPMFNTRVSIITVVATIIVTGILPIACLGQEPNGTHYVELFERGLRECHRCRNPYLCLDDTIIYANFILDDPNAIPFLAYVLKNGPFWLPKKEHHLAKCYAAMCLGTTKDSAALEPLVEALRTVDENETREEYVATYAAVALGLLGDPNAVQPLIKALYDERSTVRGVAAWKLGTLGDLRAIEPLVNCLINLKKPKFTDDSTKYTNKEKERRAKIAKYRYRRTVYHYGKAIATIVKMKLKYKELSDVQFWSDWRQKGPQFTEQRFDTIYSKWKNEKETGRPTYVVRKQFLKMVDLGIPALPFMIEKVQQDETDLIPAISILTGGKLKDTSTRAECLNWWNKNKQKWLIPFGEKIKVVVVTGGDAKPGEALMPKGPSYSWRHTDSSLALLNHERIVWQLNFNKKEGKPCFHPVGLIDGTELTWLRPADHRWHRALWFSWKYINGLNYWEEDPKTGLSEGRTDVVDVKLAPGDDYSARIVMSVSYHPPDKPAVLIESRFITVSAPDDSGQYHIDWLSGFTAGRKDVVLDRTPIPGEEGGKGYGGYAGLSVRMAKTTRGWQFVDSEWRKDKEAHGKKARWVDFSGEIGGDKAAGITIFDHPDNLRHPSPWYVEKGMPYFSPAVLFDKAYTLAAGKSLTLRYRILIHPGLADKVLLEGELKAFLKTTDIEVRMESAEKLSALGTAMVTYSGDSEVKFPDDMRALHKYGSLKKKDLEWLLENVVYLGKGKTDSTIRRNTVLAYDKTLFAEGEGTNVLFGDLRIDFLRPEQLKKLGIKPGQESDVQFESAEKLKKLGLAVAMYAADHNSKLPDTLQKLKPYVMNEQDFQWLLDNVKYVGRGKLWQQFNASKIPIAYDRTLLEETYDTNVLFDDGHVRFNTFRQLEKLGIRDEIIVHVESAKKLSDLVLLSNIIKDF